MDEKKIERINQLSRIAKQRELTPEEITERDALRREYIDAFKASLRGTLNNTVIQYPDGTKKKVERKEKIQH